MWLYWDYTVMSDSLQPHGLKHGGIPSCALGVAIAAGNAHLVHSWFPWIGIQLVESASRGGGGPLTRSQG